MAKVESGVRGGVDLLDKHDRVIPDRELAELIEPLNERIDDSLTVALQAVLRRNPGGYVSNRQYSITIPGMRESEIVFDRFYYAIGLLVDMIASPMNDPDRLANTAHIREHAQYAASIGMKYLPIVGAATLGDIESALH